MKYYDYFYGHKVSNYGLANGYLDYGTLAKCVNAILNNSIMEKTWEIGYWEQISGGVDNSEELEELGEKLEELEEEAADIEKHIIYDLETEAELKAAKKRLEEITEEREAIEEKREELEREEEEIPEIFQYYIVDDPKLLEEAHEIVYYNDELNLYVWGVTHWGTSWDYVLTDIKLKKIEE